MEQSKIDRINELARKSRTTGLTEAEKEEQAKLRQEYRDAMKRSLIGQLESITVLEADGTKHKLCENVKIYN